MLLKVCQQTELAVQRSGVGLQVELDFFTGLCVFSYKYFAVVDIHTLDHFAVCKQQELRVSSSSPAWTLIQRFFPSKLSGMVMVVRNQ